MPTSSSAVDRAGRTCAELHGVTVHRSDHCGQSRVGMRRTASSTAVAFADGRLGTGAALRYRS
ncbi:hypothetical protein ACH5A7_39245 [Streptomyces sp. NPDC018955]|uniref:hypothetical protein n=1 Tax=Streptomyces sp. NPDC018955 TaxID=3365055 RepID=UPI0037AFDEC9